GLVVGAGLGVVGLAASLRMSPLAATACAAAYLLNPYVLSAVNINPVYLTALCLLPVLPATVIAVGTRRLPLRWCAAVFAVAAPFVGYADFNPPLVGMILVLTLIAPAVAGWVDGKGAAARSIRGLLVAIP